MTTVNPEAELLVRQKFEQTRNPFAAVMKMRTDAKIALANRNIAASAATLGIGP
ncbi:MAG: hypothetical protein WA708_12940 [Acidobacteriaceae bacterium]|jgi:hypothetical protein